MSDEGRLVAGRYRLVSRIGAGAMGVVWRARDERLNRTVAVKKLLLAPGLPPDEAEEAVQRCMREGRIAARLHHPNAVTVFDVVDEDGAPCLIMEYVPSVSLAGALGDHGTLAPREVARIGVQVAAALTAAHAAGIVHRDIKPGNILLGDDGVVKITDFGISRATDDVTVTKTGMIAGTPAYLAPEVAIGREPSAASDMFSLGSTLYAASEGEPPFGLSENTLSVLHAVAAGRINPPQRSGPLTGVLHALLLLDPDQRPTASQTRDLLHIVARGDVPSLPAVVPVASPMPDATTTYVDPASQRTQVVNRRPEPSTLRPRPASPIELDRGDRSRAPLVMAGVALLALLAVGGWLLLGNRGDDSNGTDPGGGQNSVVVTTSDQPSVTTTTKKPKTTTKVETTTSDETTTTTTKSSEKPSSVTDTTEPSGSATSPSSSPPPSSATG